MKAGNSLQKNYNRLFSRFFLFVLVVFILFSFCFTTIVNSSSFTPNPPVGDVSGDKDVDLEFTISTSEVGSIWRFDWGDGSFSEWLIVGISDTFISASHSWNDYGEYGVRIKHKNVYYVESDWSDSLVVTIALPDDLDDDGWSNELEELYGTNPNDPSEFPVDTDGDGNPDVVDDDDDNDGILDNFEGELGSNSKDKSDVAMIIIEGSSFYLIDTSNDGKKNVLYNSDIGVTDITHMDGIMYLDVNGDGSRDYTYNGVLSKYSEFPWLIVIGTIVLIVILILFILIKKGFIYFYQEEYVDEE